MKTPFGAHVLMAVADVSHWMLTREGLPIWEDFWYACYSCSLKWHMERYPDLWYEFPPGGDPWSCYDPREEGPYDQHR